MIQLPPGIDATDIEGLTDWAEACALIDEPVVSVTLLADQLTASFLAGAPPEELFPEDEDDVDGTERSAPTETAERIAQDILARSAERQAALQNAAIFAAADSLEASGSPHDAYLMLLLHDLGLRYLKNGEAWLTPDGASGRLFEKVVEAAVHGLLGWGQRFGWPREPNWPDTGIVERVEMFASRMGLTLRDTRELDPNDKDVTLDVAGRQLMPGGMDGGIAWLVQCAGGKNWKSKNGDPNLELWRRLLDWDAVLIRAIAVPRKLTQRTGDWSLSRAHQRFGALILDRPRLVAGDPDRHLDPSVRSAIAAWNVDIAAKLPRA